MSSSDHHLDKIFGSLESAGFPRSLQKTLLPSWVTPEVLSDDAASGEIAVILAKRLGLRASSLFADSPTVETLRRRDTKYKRSIPNRSKNLIVATSIAVSVAEAVASACRSAFQVFPGTPREFRKDVLARFPGNWLGLRNLLMFCWGNGVPVIYLADLGTGISKMDGMVVHTVSRPVIVLSKASPLWAWQLFILAHEVAHITLRHLAPDEILVDEELGSDSYALDDQDTDERSADSFAIEVLNGRPAATYTASTTTINSAELAKAAFEFGKTNSIDPGHIALNFAHHTGNWPVGLSAVKVLQGSNPPAWAVINEAMWGGINTDALPSDTLEFLGKVTGSVDDRGG